MQKNGWTDWAIAAAALLMLVLMAIAFQCDLFQVDYK